MYAAPQPLTAFAPAIANRSLRLAADGTVEVEPPGDIHFVAARESLRADGHACSGLGYVLFAFLLVLVQLLAAGALIASVGNAYYSCVDGEVGAWTGLTPSRRAAVARPPHPQNPSLLLWQDCASTLWCTASVNGLFVSSESNEGKGKGKGKGKGFPSVGICLPCNKEVVKTACDPKGGTVRDASHVSSAEVLLGCDDAEAWCTRFLPEPTVEDMARMCEDCTGGEGSHLVCFGLSSNTE